MLSSTFPQSLDVITEFADVAQGDSIKINQFQQAMKDGNFALANSYLTSIANYDKKIINATRLNQMRDAIISIEQFYKTDISPYITVKQAEWQAIIDRFKYIGVWQNNVTYLKNNIVQYMVLGDRHLFICIKDTTGSFPLPTDETYFRQFTVAGQQGQSGGLIDTTFLWEWDSATNYNDNSIVTYLNKWWLSNTSTLNQAPYVGSPYWSVIMDVPAPLYPISSTEPSGQTNGELWFKII